MPPTPPPAGRGFEWSDDAAAALGKQVRQIVGNRDDDVHDTDRRQTDDGIIIDQLHALAETFLDRPATTAEKTRLKTLFRGGPSRRRQHDGDRRQAKASAITLELIMWKAGVGERTAAAYRKARSKGQLPAIEWIRYR